MAGLATQRTRRSAIAAANRDDDGSLNSSQSSTTLVSSTTAGCTGLASDVSDGSRKPAGLGDWLNLVTAACR